MAVVQDTLQPGMKRSLLFLSILCFALADVRDGLGPFLGVFLQSKGWTPDTIGLVTSLGGFAGMLAAVPTGALADAMHHKRLFLAFASGSIVVLSLLVLRVPTYGVAAFSQVTQGIMAAAIAPLRHYAGYGGLQTFFRPAGTQRSLEPRRKRLYGSCRRTPRVFLGYCRRICGHVRHGDTVGILRSRHTLRTYRL